MKHAWIRGSVTRRVTSFFSGTSWLRKEASFWFSRVPAVAIPLMPPAGTSSRPFWLEPVVLKLTWGWWNFWPSARWKSSGDSGICLSAFLSLRALRSCFVKLACRVLALQACSNPGTAGRLWHFWIAGLTAFSVNVHMHIECTACRATMCHFGSSINTFQPTLHSLMSRNEQDLLWDLGLGFGPVRNTASQLSLPRRRRTPLRVSQDQLLPCQLLGRHRLSLPRAPSLFSEHVASQVLDPHVQKELGNLEVVFCKKSTNTLLNRCSSLRKFVLRCVFRFLQEPLSEALLFLYLQELQASQAAASTADLLVLFGLPARDLGFAASPGRHSHLSRAQDLLFDWTRMVRWIRGMLGSEPQTDRVWHPFLVPEWQQVAPCFLPPLQ